MKKRQPNQSTQIRRNTNKDVREQKRGERDKIKSKQKLKKQKHKKKQKIHTKDKVKSDVMMI